MKKKKKSLLLTETNQMKALGMGNRVNVGLIAQLTFMVLSG